ncbi:MAG TPA: hypothetical protein VFE34_02680 [Dongiaceae bacterium]|jgi:hypothetical protein|nr:hypothetical protein [Dongiaceae bacterium]
MRNLTCLLILLALAAGGQVPFVASLPTDSAERSAYAQMPDMGCKACGGDVTRATCEIQCVALPAIEAGRIDLDETPTRVAWVMRSESGRTHSIAPDTSPPRL